MADRNQHFVFVYGDDLSPYNGILDAWGGIGLIHLLEVYVRGRTHAGAKVQNSPQIQTHPVVCILRFSPEKVVSWGLSWDLQHFLPLPVRSFSDRRFPDLPSLAIVQAKS
jgi:hypothetical protein